MSLMAFRSREYLPATYDAWILQIQILQWLLSVLNTHTLLTYNKVLILGAMDWLFSFDLKKRIYLRKIIKLLKNS